jgi:pyruvate dehydrogenase E2 component (dihydrolipoamide acetyltransferase)
MGDFTMPSLGADMEFGRVTHWLVKPGDEVKHGDVVAVVDTEKSEIEIEIFENGTIEALVVPEGARVAVGTVLARVVATKAGEVPAPPSATRPSTSTIVTTTDRDRPLRSTSGLASSSTTSRETPLGLVESPLVRHLVERLHLDVSSLAGSGPGGVVTRADVERAARLIATSAVPRQLAISHRPSSPLARRLAVELGVDLAALSGTGPDGSVVERDVRLAARQVQSFEGANTPSTGEDRQRAMQHAIGQLMARSKREIPHYYLTTTVELANAIAWLGEVNDARPAADRLLLASVLFSATARAVSKVPEVNGFYVEGAFDPSEKVHLGVAISQRGGGLIAPAIHDAETLAPQAMMVHLTDLVRRARTGRLRSSEMSDPTITVTNLGDLGVDSVLGVIYPPQVAIVGFGRLRNQPWVEDGALAIRPCIMVTLSGDHRVSDGMRGARFLSEIDHLLQEPERL